MVLEWTPSLNGKTHYLRDESGIIAEVGAVVKQYPHGKHTYWVASFSSQYQSRHRVRYRNRYGTYPPRLEPISTPKLAYTKEQVLATIVSMRMEVGL